MCTLGGSKKPAHIRHVGGDVHELREEHLEEQLPYERRASLRAFRLVRALEWFVPVLEERPTQSTAAVGAQGAQGGVAVGAVAASLLRQSDWLPTLGGTLGGDEVRGIARSHSSEDS